MMVIPFDPPLNGREESFYLELVKVRMRNRELEAALRERDELIGVMESQVEDMHGAIAGFRLRALTPEGEKAEDWGHEDCTVCDKARALLKGEK